MHNGCSVFRTDAAAGLLEAIATHDGHGSMAYGADWFSGDAVESKCLVASCSFYDNLVHVWSYQSEYG